MQLRVGGEQRLDPGVEDAQLGRRHLALRIDQRDRHRRTREVREQRHQRELRGVELLACPFERDRLTARHQRELDSREPLDWAASSVDRYVQGGGLQIEVASRIEDRLRKRLGW